MKKERDVTVTEEMEERFLLAKERIGQIEAESVLEEPFQSYFKKTAAFVLLLLEEWKRVAEFTWDSFELSEWEARNRRLYADILPERYGTCQANPAYAAKQYGLDMGRALSFLYAELHSQIASVYEQDKEALLIRMELFLEVYQAFVCEWQERKGVPDSETVRQMIYWFISDYTGPEVLKRIGNQVAAKEDFVLDIIKEADLSDLRYLYRYGEYITENEKALAVYMNSLPEETIARMADTYTEGYRIGFVAGNKDISKKKTVNIRYGIGFERMVRQAVKNFEAMGLKPVIYRALESVFHKKGVHRIGYFGAAANRQFTYDHREDEALYLDKRYMRRRLEALKEAYEAYKEEAREHGGPACIELFGEIPFAPESKATACALDEKQRALSVEYASEAGELVNAYIPGEERSFTIIAFPVPEIGKDFPAIFDAVIAMNTLDSKLYQKIQQAMIDTLDNAKQVRIKGRDKNRTDLTVALFALQHPEQESLFENCTADVNIPVGEVFTSPRLEGTHGILHVSRVFLNGLEYRDLEIHFKDGMTTEYSCKNFASEEENKKYLQDNVLFHHESLPMGEFAIGTNTTAYRAAKKYAIEDRLPILIAEKTGPHFALGDTCYSHSEDVTVYNPDGKELVAKDNACSILRKTDKAKAYFNCHTDITLPYDELGELSAVMETGETVPIIKDGKFVLPSCEELNRALQDSGFR